MREKVGNQSKAFVRSVRTRGQSQIYKCKLGGIGQLPNEVDRVAAGFASMDLIVGAKRKHKRVGDQLIVIYDQKDRLGLRKRLLAWRHGCSA